MTASMTLPQNDHVTEAAERWPVHVIALNGYWSLDGGEDTPCTATEISMTSLTLRSRTLPAFLDRVVISLPHISLLEARAAEILDDGFRVRFPATAGSKLATYVDWLDGSSRNDAHDLRRHERLVPMKRLITLARAGETPSLARIVDLSRSGVAFTTSKQLAVGEPVRLGCYAGFIVRLFEGGCAAHFNELLDEDGFGAMIDLDRATAEQPAAAQTH